VWLLLLLLLPLLQLWVLAVAKMRAWHPTQIRKLLLLLKLLLKLLLLLQQQRNLRNVGVAADIGVCTISIVVKPLLHLHEHLSTAVNHTARRCQQLLLMYGRNGADNWRRRNLLHQLRLLHFMLPLELQHLLYCAQLINLLLDVILLLIMLQLSAAKLRMAQRKLVHAELRTTH
jgi:hypothetical protein